MPRTYWEKMRGDLLSKSDSNRVANDGRLSLLKIDKSAHNSMLCSNNEEGNKESSSVAFQKDINVSQRNQNCRIKRKLLDVKNTLNKHSTSQELEIMNIFTSQEWLKTPFSRPAVNMVENNDVPMVNQELEKNISDKTMNETKSKDNNDLPEVIVNQENDSTNKNEIESKMEKNVSETKIDEEGDLAVQNEIKSNYEKELADTVEIEQENNSVRKNENESNTSTESPEIKIDQASVSNGKNKNMPTPKKSYDSLTLVVREEQDAENDLERLDENHEKLGRLSEKFSDKRSKNMHVESLKSIAQQLDITRKTESQMTRSIFNKEVIFEDLVSHNEEMFNRSKHDIISNEDNNIILSANQNIIEEESCSYG